MGCSGGKGGKRSFLFGEGRKASLAVVPRDELSPERGQDVLEEARAEAERLREL